MKNILRHTFCYQINAALILFAVVASTWPVIAAEVEGDYLYKVSLVRATPGTLLELIDLIKANQPAGRKDAAGDEGAFLLRHSQGDHWDLMLIYPIESYGVYFSEERVRTRSERLAGYRSSFRALTAFREDMYAYGPDLSIVRRAFRENDFYHVEIFNALGGKHEELLEERRMENAYLEGIGKKANLIWRVDQGSDADIFTIGFYGSLEDYASPGSVTNREEKDRIAISAGFEGRRFIGSYLRELISAHHDTLAISIRE